MLKCRVLLRLPLLLRPFIMLRQKIPAHAVLLARIGVLVQSLFCC